MDKSLRNHLTLRLYNFEDSQQRLDFILKNNVNGVFIDSYYLSRFYGFLFESINKFHKSLNYILRNQYKNASILYDSFSNASQESIINKIFQSIDFQAYYNDIVKYILKPILVKHDIYSPTLCLLFVINAYLNMLSEFKAYGFKKVGNDFVNNVLDQCIIDLNSIVWLSESEKEIINIELETWKNESKRARRSKQGV